MKKLKKIKSYPANLQLWYEQDGEVELENLYFDNCQGEWTRDCWRELDEVVSSYDAEDQDKILDALEMTCNCDFFSKV